MNMKLVVAVAAASAIACGSLLAAPAANTKVKTSSPTVQVFDPFQLTTVTGTVAVAPTATDIGTVPTVESRVLVRSPDIGEHHKPWHKTKKKPHPNPPGNDNGGGPQP